MLFHMNTLADVPLTEGTPFNSHGYTCSHPGLPLAITGRC
jgi:hypothetical protein